VLSNVEGLTSKCTKECILRLQFIYRQWVWNEGQVFQGGVVKEWLRTTVLNKEIIRVSLVWLSAVGPGRFNTSNGKSGRIRRSENNVQRAQQFYERVFLFTLCENLRFLEVFSVSASISVKIASLFCDRTKANLSLGWVLRRVRDDARFATAHHRTTRQLVDDQVGLRQPSLFEKGRVCV